jgi:hypothetical protein
MLGISASYFTIVLLYEEGLGLWYLMPLSTIFKGNIYNVT